MDAISIPPQPESSYAGEVIFDGKSHVFDALPSHRWIYYDYDDVSIAPTWTYLADLDTGHLDLAYRLLENTTFPQPSHHSDP